MHKLTFRLLKIFALSFIFYLSGTTQVNISTQHEFPPLPYAYNALEPFIDAQTMELHYSKHHRGYYDNFMKAIIGTEWQGRSMEDIFATVSKLPAAIRNMGGGYYNHNLFWSNMSPKPGQVSDKLQLAITESFGSMDAFKDAFAKASASVFGSGWVWLILNSKQKLEIVTTPNQDNPLMDVATVRGIPLLAFDVWEHAYYLKYQNRRAEYIKAFWNVLDWAEVSKRYGNAIKK